MLSSMIGYPFLGVIHSRQNVSVLLCQSKNVIITVKPKIIVHYTIQFSVYFI